MSVEAGVMQATGNQKTVQKIMNEGDKEGCRL